MGDKQRSVNQDLMAPPEIDAPAPTEVAAQDAVGNAAVAQQLPQLSAPASVGLPGALPQAAIGPAPTAEAASAATGEQAQGGGPKGHAEAVPAAPPADAGVPGPPVALAAPSMLGMAMLDSLSADVTGGSAISMAGDSAAAKQMGATPGGVAQLGEQCAVTSSLVADFRSRTEVTIENLLQSGRDAAVLVQSQATESTLNIQGAALQSQANSNTTQLGQSLAVAGLVGAEQANVMSAVSGDIQTIGGEATAQAAQVQSDGATAAQTLEGQTQAQVSAVQASGTAQTARVSQELDAQVIALRNTGQSKASGYGSDEKGSAQGNAVTQVASKGEPAVHGVAAPLAEDVQSSAGEAAGIMQEKSADVVAKTHGLASSGAAYIEQGGADAAGALGQLQGAAATEMATGGAALAQGLVAQGSLLNRAIGQDATAVADAIGHGTQASGDQIIAATETVATNLREQAATAAATVEGLACPDPEGAEMTLCDVSDQINESADQASSAITSGGEQGAAEICQAESTGTAAVVAAEGQGTLAMQTMAAAGMVSVAGLGSESIAQSAQCVAETQVAMSGAAAETTTANTSRAQQMGTSMGQAAGDVDAELGRSVDGTLSQNESHIGGIATAGMGSVAAEVGRDAERSGIGKVVDAIVGFFKSAWDAVASVGRAVGGFLIDVVAFVAGASLQLISNMLFGLLDPLLDMVDNDAFHSGRNLGDAITLVLSIIAIIAGLVAIGIGILGTTGGGVAISVGSGGTLALPAGGAVVAIDTALVAAGGLLIAEGIVMMAAWENNGGRARGSRGRSSARHGGGIRQVEQVSTKYKMTPEQRRAFGDYVEETKRMSGRRGNDNYSWKELCELAEEFLGI